MLDGLLHKLAEAKEAKQKHVTGDKDGFWRPERRLEFLVEPFCTILW